MAESDPLDASPNRTGHAGDAPTALSSFLADYLALMPISRFKANHDYR